MAITYAIDCKTGLKINAVDANRDTRYKCFYCGCPMHKKVSQKGTHFFAVFPNTGHEEEVCRYLYDAGLHNTLNPFISTADFLDDIFKVQVPQKAAEHSNDSSGSEPKEPDEELKEVGIRRLSDFVKFVSFRDDISFKDGSRMASFVTTCSDADKYFSEGIKEPKHIFIARFESIDVENRAICFVMFWGPKSDRKKVFLQFVFDRTESGKKMIDDFIKKYLKEENSDYEIKDGKKDFIILGVWDSFIGSCGELGIECLPRIRNSYCQTRTCLGLLTARCISLKQIEAFDSKYMKSADRFDDE